MIIMGIPPPPPPPPQFSPLLFTDYDRDYDSTKRTIVDADNQASSSCPKALLALILTPFVLLMAATR